MQEENVPEMWFSSRPAPQGARLIKRIGTSSVQAPHSCAWVAQMSSAATADLSPGTPDSSSSRLMLVSRTLKTEQLHVMAKIRILKLQLQPSDGNHLRTPPKKTKGGSRSHPSGADGLSCRQRVAWDRHISTAWELVRNTNSQPPPRLSESEPLSTEPSNLFNKLSR